MTTFLSALYHEVYDKVNLSNSMLLVCFHPRIKIIFELCFQSLTIWGVLTSLACAVIFQVRQFHPQISVLTKTCHWIYYNLPLTTYWILCWIHKSLTHVLQSSREM
jgi:hypothetical protein